MNKLVSHGQREAMDQKHHREEALLMLAEWLGMKLKQIPAEEAIVFDRHVAQSGKSYGFFGVDEDAARRFRVSKLILKPVSFARIPSLPRKFRNELLKDAGVLWDAIVENHHVFDMRSTRDRLCRVLTMGRFNLTDIKRSDVSQEKLEAMVFTSTVSDARSVCG